MKYISHLFMCSYQIHFNSGEMIMADHRVFPAHNIYPIQELISSYKHMDLDICVFDVWDISQEEVTIDPKILATLKEYRITTLNVLHPTDKQIVQKLIYNEVEDAFKAVGCGIVSNTDCAGLGIHFYPKSFIDQFEDLFYIFDGRVIPHDDSNPHSLRFSHESKSVKNLIPEQTKLQTSVGQIVSSGYATKSLVQHVFSSPPDRNIKKINFIEQWLSPSKDINEEQMVGYIFNHTKIKPREMSIIARVGPPKTPAIDVPTPKKMVVEGYQDNEWIPITTEFEVPKESWQFLTPIAVTLSDSNVKETEEEVYQGIRLRILQWYAGADKNLKTGLMRLHFSGLEIAEDCAKMPLFQTLPGYVYAQINPKKIVPLHHLNTYDAVEFNVELNNTTKPDLTHIKDLIQEETKHNKTELKQLNNVVQQCHTLYNKLDKTLQVEIDSLKQKTNELEQRKPIEAVLESQKLPSQIICIKEPVFDTTTLDETLDTVILVNGTDTKVKVLGKYIVNGKRFTDVNIDSGNILILVRKEDHWQLTYLEGQQ